MRWTKTEPAKTPTPDEVLEAAELVQAMIPQLDLTELPQESDVHATQSDVTNALWCLILYAQGETFKP